MVIKDTGEQVSFFNRKHLDKTIKIQSNNKDKLIKIKNNEQDCEYHKNLDQNNLKKNFNVKNQNM